MAAMGGALRHLESDIDTLRGLDALGDFERVLCLLDIDAHRLFAVHMLARRDRGFKMLHVEEWRRRNLDQIDIRRGGQLLKGVRAVKQELAVDGARPRLALSWLKCVRPACELVGKEIGQRHHLRGRVLRERSGDGSAAVAAAQQAVPHRRVGLVAEGRAWLEQKHAGRASRSLNEFPAFLTAFRCAIAIASCDGQAELRAGFLRGRFFPGARPRSAAGPRFRARW